MTTTASYYHCSKQAIARGQGRSAVAAAAYRTGTCIENEREHSVVDYSRKHGVVASWTIAPDGAPAWASDTGQLWNAVEAKETRKNSQLAHEITLALPAVLDDAQREGIMERFADALSERYGCAVTVAIHEPSTGGDDRNHHAHVMLTTRRIDATGWGTKIRELNSLPQVSEEVAYIRELSAGLINDALADAGHDERVDHRSYAARGIDQVPTTHLGPRVTGAERQGFTTERGDINRAIIEERLRWQMEQDAPQVTPELDAEFSRRWGDDWQPLQRGADALAASEAAPLERTADAQAISEPAPLERSEDAPAMAEAAPLERGTPASTSEEHTGWRRFVDRVRAKAAEFFRDETSGAPEGQKGIAARVFDAGWRLFVGIREGEGVELAEGIQQSAELAYDLATEKPEETATTSGGSDGEKHAPEPPRSFAERVRDSAAAMLHNERGMVPDIPGDAFDRMVAEWAQAPPPDERPLPHDPPEPHTPERDGPDLG